MKMKEAIISVLTNWNNFSGRACRSEFWFFCLAAVLVQVIISIIEIATGMVDIESTEMGILSIIFTLLILVPSISVTSRRLQDRGLSGWWQLLYITVIGIIPLVIWWATEGTKKNNSYGKPIKLKK